MNEDRLDKNTVFTNKVRAGKRTYFIDVKATRGNDYYIVITEERKQFRPDGSAYFDRSKLFLYSEDFDKFNEALQAAEDHVDDLRSGRKLPGDDQAEDEQGESPGDFEEVEEQD